VRTGASTASQGRFLCNTAAVKLVFDRVLHGSFPLSSFESRRAEPPLDGEGETELEVLSVTVERGWTSVTFERLGLGTDDSVSGGGTIGTVHGCRVVAVL